MPVDPLPVSFPARRRALAELAAARSRLLTPLLQLASAEIDSLPVLGTLSGKDLLVTSAGWDSLTAESLTQPFQAPSTDDIANREASFAAASAELRFDNALALALKTRRDLITQFAQQPKASAEWLLHRAQQEHALADALHTWRKALTRDHVQGWGPQPLLAAWLRAAHANMVMHIRLVSAETAQRLPIGPERSLHDMVAHLADWLQMGVSTLKALNLGREPDFSHPHLTDFDAFNAASRKAHANDAWPTVFGLYRSGHQQLLQAVHPLTPERLSAEIATPWGRISTYRFVMIWGDHDQEHAHDLRTALQLPNIPE